MKHVLRLTLALLVALALPAGALAQSNGDFIQYRPSLSVIQSLQVIGGAVTCGSTTASCVITNPLTATGGTDIGFSLQVTGDLATGDSVLRIGDGGNPALFALSGAGSVTLVGQILATNLVAGATSVIAFNTRTRLSSAQDGALAGTNAAETDHQFYVMGGTAKTLTESSATDVVLVNVASNTIAGGDFEYAVMAQDATNTQNRSGRVTYNVVNEGGTEVCVLGTPEELDNTPTGTLTAAITCVTTPTNGALLQINAASSLTQTALNVKWQIRKNHGTGTIVPQ